MKIAFISTYARNGGAALSAWRTAEALRSQGTKVTTVVREEKTNIPQVESAYQGMSRYLAYGKEAYERLQFARRESSKDIRFYYSFPHIGTNIHQLKSIQEADVLHLHWIHKAFLSLRGLKKLHQLGKPIIWQLHDMWAFTGGCHYSSHCRNFEQACGNCWYLKQPRDHDLSHRFWKDKSKAYAQMDFHFVTSSEWLAREALQSSLLRNRPVQAIPTPIDTDLFKPMNQPQILKGLQLDPNRKQLLFVAMNIAEKRKGFTYLKKALILLKEKYPKVAEQIDLLVMGKAQESAYQDLPYPVKYLGRLSDPQKIAEAYNAADLYLMPSLEDNLPNTILETLACGTPVVAFETGGIPEMVTHEQQGFIAPKRDAEALAHGIHWFLSDPERELQVAESARQKALKQYSYPAIAQQYLNLYQSLLT
ncbi:MAG: glycosyltransferase family 4 protein [Bacteroidota bacterium]